MRRLIVPVACALAGAATPAAAKTCPNILFVLDASSSMAEDPNGGTAKPSKFELLQKAVVSIVNQYGDRVPFGVQIFHSDAFKNDQKCFDDTKIDVEIPGPQEDRSGAATKVIQAVQAAMPAPGSKTNTGEAVKRARQSMTLMDTKRDNIIVLVTDGEPSCNSKDLMTLATSGYSEYTIDEINSARNQKPAIYTFVVGFDGDVKGVNKSNLNDMAYAGGKAPANCGNPPAQPCYYSATDEQKFKDALAKIIDQTVGGEFGSIMCDDSCYGAGCPPGQVCVKGELSPVAQCVPDPCMGAKCAKTEFCREGKCVKACVDGCKAGEKCKDGACVKDQCSGVTCGAGQACNPNTGKCGPDLCAEKTCSGMTRCDPGSGRCIDDMCHVIQCPSGTTCMQGNCVGKYTGSRSGCAVGATPRSSDFGGALALAFGLAVLGLVASRRRR